ncbi:MAG: hypothetical protein Q4B26_15420 [Eubacteriales bacterium]|nr:hypothetical protein [Eubacteriales bacterium]
MQKLIILAQRVWNPIPQLWHKFFPTAPEKTFLREWTTHLIAHAKVYNGMFTGIKRVSEGTAKKPEKIINEWCTRTRYKFEDSPVNELCQKYLHPLCEKGDAGEYQKWTRLLLAAAEKAGITYQKEVELILDDTSVMAYIDWDGEELYSGDEVEVMTPAWYQNGKVLEQGHCKKREMEGE